MQNKLKGKIDAAIMANCSFHHRRLSMQKGEVLYVKETYLEHLCESGFNLFKRSKEGNLKYWGVLEYSTFLHLRDNEKFIKNIQIIF